MINDGVAERLNWTMISTDYNSINLGNIIFKISESRQKVVNTILLKKLLKWKWKWKISGR